MRIVPDSMAKYATYELSELLRTLTPDQRRAIGRIVRHHYLDNKPLAHLFEGDDPICSENTYYKRGVLDEQTGEWRKQGWSHQPAFKQALEMATRLALQAEQGEEVHAVRETIRRARLASAPILTGVIRIATANSETARDRIAASKMVLDIALSRTGIDEPTAETDDAADWWSAANHD